MTTNIYPVSSAGAPAEVIWSWNGLDTTQFDAAPSLDFPNPPIATGTTLAVVADPTIGNMLRLRSDRAGSLSPPPTAAIWLITQTFPRLSLDQYRYVIRARIVSIVLAGGVAQAYAGFAFMANGGVPSQFGFLTTLLPGGTANGRARVEAGLVVTNGTAGTVGTTPPDLIVEVEIIGHHAAGAPDWYQQIRTEGSFLVSGPISDGYRQVAISAAALAAGWATATLDRIGLALFENGINAPGVVTLDIANLAVLRYPTDR